MNTNVNITFFNEEDNQPIGSILSSAYPIKDSYIFLSNTVSLFPNFKHFVNKRLLVIDNPAFIYRFPVSQVNILVRLEP